MTLKESTLKALDYTARLESALGLDDMDLVAEIIQIRGQVMQAFEVIHRAASAPERMNSRTEIQQLIQADKLLQDRAGLRLREVAREFRDNMANQPPRQNQAYGAGQHQACVDRKA
jgi:hypothetical protein|nr:hypothetical protein [Candidatus Krumholzibacteria bacterium]